MLSFHALNEQEILQQSLRYDIVCFTSRYTVGWFSFLDWISDFIKSFYRDLIDGVIRDLITRPSLALYLARRYEMMSVHELHYFYTRPGHLPVVHSPISDKPFQVIRVIISEVLDVRWDLINLI